MNPSVRVIERDYLASVYKLVTKWAWIPLEFDGDRLIVKRGAELAYVEPNGEYAKFCS